MNALLATIVGMLVFDGIWLGFVARGFYQRHLGFLAADHVNWAAAGAFYLIYAVGLTVFATQPGVESGSVLTALWRGALLGFVAYATYDLTNQATVKNWPALVTVVDLAWGTFLSAAVAALATAALARLG